MSQGTTVVCPRKGCWNEFQVYTGFEGIERLVLSESYIRVLCHRCGLEFNALPRRGTYTLQGGRFRRVSAAAAELWELLRDAPEKDRRELRESITSEASSSPEAVIETLRKYDWFEQWAKDNPAKLGLLFLIIGALLQSLTLYIDQQREGGEEPGPAPSSAPTHIIVPPTQAQMDEMVKDALERQAAEEAVAKDVPPDVQP